MLGPLYRLVDGRTEYKMPGGAFETLIKDVWGIHVSGVAHRATARAGRGRNRDARRVPTHRPGLLARLSGCDEVLVPPRFSGRHQLRARGNLRSSATQNCRPKLRG